MHEQHHVVHNDIKPDNVLVATNGIFKITDFGTVRAIGGENRTAVGTPFYMSPEMVSGKPYHPGMDIWSVGIMTLAMALNRLPFATTQLRLKPPQVVMQTKLGTCRPVIPTDLPELLRDFISVTLHEDINQRSSADQLTLHPFLTSELRFNSEMELLNSDGGIPSGSASDADG